MSRTVISVVVAGVIVALTAIAFFVTSASFDERARKDSAAQLRRAYHLIQSLNQLQSIDVSNKAERLASQPWFIAAINLSGTDRKREADLGFQRFMSEEKGSVRPDIIALVDKKGELIAMYETSVVVPKQWLARRDDKPPAASAEPPAEDRVETIIPALNQVLRRKMIISDLWNDGNKMLRIGVAPVVDPYIPVAKNEPEHKNIIGAIVLAYAQTSKSAQQDRELLGTEIAYHDGGRIVASSFTRGPGGEEDTAKVKPLSELLAPGTLLDKQDGERVTVDGTDYFAAAARLARAATRTLPGPPAYPPITAGALVLSPIVPSPEAGTVKLFVIVLGLGALAIAMLGVSLAHRRLVAQIDQVELGVTDIINGNVDRTFRPVGEELEGLSNGLNVMLARLLGRPEPGEEEIDDEGNPIIPGRVEFEEGEGGGEGAAPPPDPDLAALAQEAEPDYYKRVYTEYQAAKRATGHPDEGSFENFIAKLKVNEGKLRAQYQCRAVRFRVVTKDGKVSLKPVPIFA
ncbi:MAG TPA: MXAN_5187 C-terminal domain-containing protein [Kofleriaceae bacterium]|nr:MXAN_5187 C-terminal domain-containing protein [Kofleriaceae bacterium]